MGGAELIHNFAEVVTMTRFAGNYQVAVITFAGDFVTGNVINLTLGSLPIGPIPFHTDSDTTLEDLATALEAQSDVASSVADTAQRRITLTSNKAGNEFIFTDFTITGGATQTTFTISKTGGYIDGVWHDTEGVETEIEMSVQPLNGDELLKLPEGDRSRQWMKGYTAVDLVVADELTGSHGDYITYNGKNYEVMKAERWKITDLNHFKVLLAEVNVEYGGGIGKYVEVG